MEVFRRKLANFRRPFCRRCRQKLDKNPLGTSYGTMRSLHVFTPETNANAESLDIHLHDSAKSKEGLLI
jgi:hypothetical protein